MVVIAVLMSNIHSLRVSPAPLTGLDLSGPQRIIHPHISDWGLPMCFADSPTMTLEFQISCCVVCREPSSSEESTAITSSRSPKAEEEEV